MKKFLSNKKTAIIFLVVAVLLLGVYTYMLARPVSYGMEYYNKTTYMGTEYESTQKFNNDTTMLTINKSFPDGRTSRYYYKNGYVFDVVASTDVAYEKEVEYINNNFETAVKTPFYANKINAFKIEATGIDGYTLVYTCKGAVAIAVVGGVIVFALIGFTVVSFIFSNNSKGKKAKKSKK